MEAVILMGLQASGKSSFYRERFFRTHVRINLDMLKTRHREKLLIEACLRAKQAFVVDNTNPTKEDRQRYFSMCEAYGFSMIGYYFASSVESCKQRNEKRDSEEVIPLKGLLSTYKRLELPSQEEGFQQLYYVSFVEGQDFEVKEWNDEI